MSHMLANNDGMQPIEWGWAVQGYTSDNMAYTPVSDDDEDEA